VSAEVFVELQHEELPASMVRPALEGLRTGLLDLLKGVEHGAVRTFATPRRLAVAVADVAQARPVTESLVTGPAADRAFQDGEPTRAALGFARGKGVDVSELKVVDGPRGKVVAVEVRQGGERTADLLAAGLEGLVLGIPFAKSMTWDTGGVRFGRPLHRVNALYAGEVIAGAVGPLAAGNTTVGHRLSELGELTFAGSAEWLAGLRERRVEPDLEARKAKIAMLLAEAAETLQADPIDEPDLLEEVTHLVEWPVLVIGAFDEALLDLPPRLLVQSMKSHQRYFPVHRAGELTQHFVVIANNPWGDTALIAEGNARVLRARFHDARFFYTEDLEETLEAHGRQLERMQWIRGLGSMADKQARIADLAEDLAAFTGADPAAARRASALCKSDLTTQMVGEFPDLQGHMGRLYATAQGEPPAVAHAIEEHYLPRFSGDATAASDAGAAVALADRLDTLVGCFGVGITPTGGGDPQGLRRAASGLLAILEARGLRVDLHDLFRRALATFQHSARHGAERFGRWSKVRGIEDEPRDPHALVDDLVQFTLTRFKAAAVAGGASADRVDAVIEVGDPDPVVLSHKLAALEAIAGTDEFETVLVTFKRVLNITRGQVFPAPDPAILAELAEKALADAIARARSSVSEAAAALDFDGALAAMLGLQAPVADFFDAVLVDDPDPAVKARRMGLLLEAASEFRTLADFRRISTR